MRIQLYTEQELERKVIEARFAYQQMSNHELDRWIRFSLKLKQLISVKIQAAQEVLDEREREIVPRSH